MAFLLPNLSISILSIKSNKTFIHNTNHSLSTTTTTTSLQVHSPTLQGGGGGGGGAQVNTYPGAQDKQHHDRDEFYVNLGLAVRTLREDLPLLFTKDLNYDIYRDDITFLDPLNTFTGIDKYKLIFWALRFHGRMLFRDISLDIYRIWQPSENVILIRWNLKGIPRVPWEAKGEFQGTSRYKLDRKGKIYEHKVDNLSFNLPRQLKPAASVLDLVAASAMPPSPNPTFLWGPVDVYSSSWLEFYKAVRETIDQEGHSLAQQGLVTCS
ncbi:hypothetical protein ACFE04_023985 [Oxalis oulophora]